MEEGVSFRSTAPLVQMFDRRQQASVSPDGISSATMTQVGAQGWEEMAELRCTSRNLII